MNEITTGFLSSVEIGDRKINSRMIKIINLTTGINSKWLETGKGEMFASEKDNEYRRNHQSLPPVEPVF